MMVVRITKEAGAHTTNKSLRESMLDIEGGDVAGAGSGCRSAHGGREELTNRTQRLCNSRALQQGNENQLQRARDNRSTTPIDMIESIIYSNPYIIELFTRLVIVEELLSPIYVH
jgi:hypothetical protein